MGRRTPHATLQMIADETGVTPSTVSRVLNSASDASARRWASAETITRVRAAAASHGYTPNPQAVGLRTRRSRLIGVIVPRLQDYVLATIYEGIDEAATEKGFATFVTNSLDDPRKRARATETLLSRRVEGMIFGDAQFDGEFLQGVAERGMKFVLVSRRARDFPSVTCDDHLGGRLVGEHLVSIGRRDVAILAGEPYASTGLDRTRGAIDALREAGVDVPPHRIVHGHFDAQGGREAAERILDSRPLPDAIFAANDFAAIGVMGALRDRKLSIPDDVALVGYNDTALAAELPTPLTTVRSPMHEIGRLGLEMLLDLLQGAEVEPLRLPPTLVVRESTVSPEASRSTGTDGSGPSV
ncbi:LacI family DNA-binding transcriptional regulator [Microbispora sp. H13382]|uniref:LacI family DNA-binding transcriptional regulator n=1 Tax=Microbispora sp. H13382 TaxID=2729112 RepID=UPI0015FF2514|nr:LacI family DNA-binding transcriptional regulator [Microbispora sp. H13382]